MGWYFKVYLLGILSLIQFFLIPPGLDEHTLFITQSIHQFSPELLPLFWYSLVGSLVAFTFDVFFFNVLYYNIFKDKLWLSIVASSCTSLLIHNIIVDQSMFSGPSPWTIIFHNYLLDSLVIIAYATIFSFSQFKKSKLKFYKAPIIMNFLGQKYIIFILFQTSLCALFAVWGAINAFNIDGLYGFAKIFFICTDVSVSIAALISIFSLAIKQWRAVAELLTGVNMLIYGGIIIYNCFHRPPTLFELFLYMASSSMVVISFFWYMYIIFYPDKGPNTLIRAVPASE